MPKPLFSPFRHELLNRILSQPSAPFREGHVIATLQQALKEGGVPHFQDPSGNILVGVSSRAAYDALIRSRSSEPLRLFIAHMDHPGFHGTTWTDDGRLKIRWLGGSPTQFLEGSQVWLSDRGAWRANGTLVEARLHSSGRMIESGVVQIGAAERPKMASAIFGGFGFRAPVWNENGNIYTKAADDLVGCFAIVSLALDLFSKSRKRRPGGVPFLGLLTRAEEVGFIGAIAHLELGWLKKATRPLLCVNLETSRALPGAEIGKGPVVRLGDRFTGFDPGALRVFSDLAESRLPGGHQRRVMDGGTCEGTAATVYGLRSVGISVPLGNYHNQCFEGGPDSRGSLGPAPEFVHPNDVQGLLGLCHGLLQPGLPWMAPWERKRADFKKSLKKHASLLKSRP